MPSPLRAMKRSLERICWRRLDVRRGLDSADFIAGQFVAPEPTAHRGRIGPSTVSPADSGTFRAVEASIDRAAKHLIGNRFPFETEVLPLRAITLAPGVPHSAQLEDIPEPPESHGSILVRTLALGVCGTDREIVAGEYGEAPPGSERLVLGHESLGEVIAAPPGSGFAAGDRVVGIVRRPDPVPCPACAAGEWDMCRNGRYTERGIKGCTAIGSERFRIEPELRRQGRSGARRARRAAGAGQHRRQGVGSHRAHRPAIPFLGAARLLVTGAGPVGLLAAMMGEQRGYEVYVLDRAKDGTEAAARARPRRASISPARSKTSSSLRPTSSSNAPARRR